MAARNRLLTGIIVALVATTSSPATSTSTETSAQSVGRAPIDEQGFVAIGGIPQWLTISGQDRRNPVILFLHGGPGNPLSPYSRSVYGGWTNEFTIVQWDQRGAGRTFGRNPEAAQTQLTVELMASDGVEVAEHLRTHLGTDRIILVAGSWGSALGVHMIRLRPDLFRLYVGVGQLVSETDNQAASVRRLSALAASSGDGTTLGAIQALGPPPWTNPRNFGILRRLTRAYEARMVDPAPASWWVPEDAYSTPAYRAEYEAGEDYSYLQFVGLRGNGLLSAVDLNRLGNRFDVPIFLVQGAEDLVTAPEVARAWFDRVDAPRKQFVLVPRMGHDPNPASNEAVLAILREQVRDPDGRQ